MDVLKKKFVKVNLIKKTSNPNVFKWSTRLEKIGFCHKKEFHLFQNSAEVTINFVIKRVIDVESGDPVTSIDFKVDKIIKNINFELTFQEVKSSHIWSLIFKDIPDDKVGHVESWVGDFPDKFYDQNIDISLSLDFQILNMKPMEKVENVIGQLALQDFLSDIQVLVEDQAYPGHKMILMARSDIFKREFGKIDKFKIHDFPAEVVQKSLRFLYTDEIPNEDIDTNILSFASKYKIPSLLEVSVRSLKAKIDKDNVMDILVTASQIENDELIKSASDFCVKNRGQIRKMKNWDDIKVKHPIIFAKLFETTLFSPQ